MPRSSASRDDSRMVTGRPALAMLIAMPPPIVPQPTTPSAEIGRTGVSFGTSGILATSRSAKNACPLRRRLVRLAEPVEHRPLVLQRRGVGHGQRRLHAVDAGVRRVEAAGALRHLLAELVEDLRPAARRLHVLLQLRRPPQRAAVGRELAGARNRRLHEVTLDPFVDEAERHRLLHRVELAADDHVERLLDADEPRHPLRTAGAGQDAERHFRQAEPRAGRRQPHVAGQRHLHPAAGRHTVDGGDHRLRRRLDLVQDRGQGGRPRGRRRAELPDVGAAAEHPVRTGDDDRRDHVVGQRLGDTRAQRGAHGEAQAVDGRIAQTEQRHVVVAFERDGTGHALPSCAPAPVA